jgi:urea transporter
MHSISDRAIPEPIRSALRGVGQVFFQENALTGLCFLIGIALESPRMAIAGAVGAAIGTATAYALKYDEAERSAGLFGFNSALVGIAVPFFFRLSVLSTIFLIVGCAVAAPLTWAMRRYIRFPTYTSPFIVTTWCLYFLGQAVGLSPVEPGSPLGGVSFAAAVAHGVSQVMFQASVWTGILFLAGIALNDWRHALLVLAGAITGTLLGSYHHGLSALAIDPESLVNRSLAQSVTLGLYGYNATLAAVALFLWRRSLIAPVLGMFVSVPLTNLLPHFGIPALTAPFVLATWAVLAIGWLDGKLFAEPVSAGQ